jgi:CheY-like chemotaxis protein
MPAGRLRSVLCADDDADILEIVRAALCSTAGLDVRTARSGEELIDLAHERTPDLVLVDHMMPGLDGPSTLARLRASPRLEDVPVIFLTARVMPAEIERLIRLGALGVIGKPFDPLKLGAEILALWNKGDPSRARLSAPHASPAKAARARLTVPAAAAASPAPAASSEVQGQVEALAARFFARARQDIALLRQSLAAAARGEMPVLAQCERIGHSIHGTAAMLGFSDISALGAAIEHLVRGSREGAGVKGASVKGAGGESAGVHDLRDLTEQLAQAVEAAARTAIPSMSLQPCGA